MIIRLSKHMRGTFFLDHYKVVLLLSLSLIIVCYFFVDIPLAQHFRHIPHTEYTIATLFTNLIEADYNLYLWSILFLLLRYLWKKPELANRCLLIFISLLIVSVLTEIVKFLLGRARPELLFSQNLYGFTFFSSSDSSQSLPSLHACTIGVICGALACFYPRWSVRLLLLSFILAFSRVILTVHFLSDIIVGITLGILTAQWTFKIMQKEHFQFSKKSG